MCIVIFNLRFIPLTNCGLKDTRLFYICMLYIDLYYRNTIVLVYDWCRDKRTPFICNNKGTVRKSSVDELEIFKAQEINVILGRPYKM